MYKKKKVKEKEGGFVPKYSEVVNQDLCNVLFKPFGLMVLQIDPIFVSSLLCSTLFLVQS